MTTLNALAYALGGASTFGRSSSDGFGGVLQQLLYFGVLANQDDDSGFMDNLLFSQYNNSPQRQLQALYREVRELRERLRDYNDSGDDSNTSTSAPAPAQPAAEQTPAPPAAPAQPVTPFPPANPAAPWIVGNADKATFINFVSQTMLGRPSPYAAIKAIADDLETGDLDIPHFVEQVYYQQIGTTENRVASLYRTILGRNPSNEEMAPYVAQLNAGRAPHEVVKEMLGVIGVKADRFD